MGHFNFFDSIAHKNNFLEKPIIDIWVFKFFKILSKIFEEISQFDRGKPSKELLLEVHIPYKYRHRSFLIIMEDFFSSIWKMNLRDLVYQILVLLRIKKDPYDSLINGINYLRIAPESQRYFFYFFFLLNSLRFQFLSIIKE